MLKNLFNMSFILMFSFNSMAVMENGDCEGKGVMTPLQQQLKISKALVNKTYSFHVKDRSDLCRLALSRTNRAEEVTMMQVDVIAKKYNISAEKIMTDHIYEFNCYEGESIVRSALKVNFLTIRGLIKKGMDPNILILDGEGGYTTIMSEVTKRYKETKDHIWLEAMRFFKKLGAKPCHKLRPNPCQS